MKLFAILLGTLVTCATVQAQSTYPLNPNYTHPEMGGIAPYQGTYYDPTQPGTGIQVDLGANGNAFVTFYTYTPTGQPDWYIVQGTYQTSDEETRWTTGVIGTLSGPLYQAFGGQCLGCVYTPTGGAVVSPYTASLTWVNSREAKMVVGNQNWDMIAPNFDTGSDGDYLKGSWAATDSLALDNSNAAVPIATSSAVITMTPVSIPIQVDPGSENETDYDSDAISYLGTCLSPIGQIPQGFNTLCVNFLYDFADGPGTGGFSNAAYDRGTPAQAIFWYNPKTNRFGMDAAIEQKVNGVNTYVIGPDNIHYDLYLEGFNSLVGRGIIEGPQQSGSQYRTGGAEAYLSLVKVPNGTIGQ